MPDAKGALRRQLEKTKEVLGVARLQAGGVGSAASAAEARKSSTEDQPSRRESEPT